MYQLPLFYSAQFAIILTTVIFLMKASALNSRSPERLALSSLSGLRFAIFL
ncbi:hypothetical protein BACCAP_04306 [Pseudoflavonifractor capillosus ATCC 29799]|uniref:Uncharacterized protein n=1 Tax=Pseudoflavonifractor capillosus ATCC 29799 TaxID=411467 RepID=A6P1D9_9FIRM|nr:hypothetical protein BACCAP_04306 [Pseudoflavonifractor capillosus ATCC 29799]